MTLAKKKKPARVLGSATCATGMFDGLDSLSWTFIGAAVRLAQVLGIENHKTYTLTGLRGPRPDSRNRA